MKRIILHSPVPIEHQGNSGSHIRPFEMLKAFQEKGYAVDVIAGYGRERNLALKELKNKIKAGYHYDFLYSETSTMPMFLTEKHHLPIYSFVEVSLFRLCRKNNIPITIYYRDVHWKYNLFKTGTSLFKKTISKFFYRLELLLLKKFTSILFLPSLEMRIEESFFLKTKEVYELPPGVPDRPFESKEVTDPVTFLYVGGITPPLYDLRKVFNEYSNSRDSDLTIVCRKEEWDLNQLSIPSNSNIKIRHVSGGGLEEEYKKSQAALVTLGRHPYHRFSMPVKLFEAIGFNKPVIVFSSMSASAKLVETFDIGYLIDSEKDINDVISKIKNDNSSHQKKITNTEKFKKDNSWRKRADFVADKVQGFRNFE